MMTEILNYRPDLWLYQDKISELENCLKSAQHENHRLVIRVEMLERELSESGSRHQNDAAAVEKVGCRSPISFNLKYDFL